MFLVKIENSGLCLYMTYNMYWTFENSINVIYTSSIGPFYSIIQIQNSPTTKTNPRLWSVLYKTCLGIDI